MKLAIFALLSVAAQALQAHLSAHDDHVTVGRQMEMDVVFDKCIEAASLAELFVITGGVVTGAICVEESTQRFRCTGTLASATDAIVRVSLPQDSVSAVGLLGAPVVMNQASNTLSFQVTKPIQGVFSTPANGDAQLIAGPRVEYTLTFNQPVHPAYGPSKNYIDVVASDSSPMELESLVFTDSVWFFTLRAEEGIDFTVSLKSGAVVPQIGDDANGGGAVTPITRRIGQPGVECVVSAWSEWSTCDGTCSQPTATFVMTYPQQTRSRTVVQQPGAGAPECPPLTESQDCTSLPRCWDKSRPFSGESGNECTGPPLQGNRCSASKPRSPATPFVEDVHCACDSECISRQDCCQGFFTQNCCSSGLDCAGANPELVYTRQFPQATFPLTCATSDCKVGAHDYKEESPDLSYYCYCDTQCLQDQNCCGGEEAVRACLAANNVLNF